PLLSKEGSSHADETLDQRASSPPAKGEYREAGRGSVYYSIGENQFSVQVAEILEDEILLELNGIQERFTVVKSGNDYFVQHAQNGTVNLKRKERFPLKEAEKVKGGYISPMPGKVIKVLVEPGQEVKSGDGLLVLLSMKMENTICADEDGTVEEVFVAAEDDVEAGKLLLKMKGTE
ncbi:MAG: acetyl-CoA carboxylase biotin carboxyl carrier protein subunit, partial [Flavobacteriales bacterium]|nr:acetyl-CoA carboxylase biotin carboxyl carrier protein subunit [Flavobacteriales bacterium]